MRAIQKGGAATIVVWVLGGAACDGGTDVQTVERLDEGSALSFREETTALTPAAPERTKALGPAFDHRGRPFPDKAAARPMNGARLDNLTCETAARIPDAGVINVPITKDNPREGCQAEQYTQRFFKVTAQPNEVVWVTVDGPGGPNDFSDLYLSASAECRYNADGCMVDSGWHYRSVGFENTTKAPVEHFVSLTTAPWTPQQSFSLKVERATRAANADCGKALPLTDGLRVEGLRGSVAFGTQSSLFYYVDVPARSRIAVKSLDGTAIFHDTCDTSGQFSANGDFSNAGDTSKRVFVEVQRNWWDEPNFDIALSLAQLAPEASCASPRTLAVGDVAELPVDAGGQGPAQCWCISPERSLFVDVEVPPNSSVSVVGIVANEQSGAQLIELPSACADSCGDNASFGWSESPATLVFDNDSAEATVRRLLVTSNQVWHEDGTVDFPPVSLSVTLNKE